ncbi:MAG: ABC transporter permease [Clostridia bacterium]|nr:ABC transporter permease [Clostridia bacterium]
MVKSEFRRLTSDKKFLIIFFGVLAAMILIITIYLRSESTAAPLKDIEAEMAKNQQNYELYLSWYKYSVGEGPCPGDPDRPLFIFNGVYWHPGVNYKDVCEYYKHLVDTQTINADYWVPNNLNDARGVYSDYSGVSSMYWITLFTFYPLVLFAVFSAAKMVVAPYEKGKMKNYLAAPVSERAIMGGKLFSLAAVDFIIWFIVFVWGLIFGLFGRPMYKICYTGSGYAVQSLFSSCIIDMFQTLVAMLFISCFTVFLGQFIKKSLPTGVASVLFVVVSFALYMLIIGDSIAGIVEPGEWFGPFPVIGLYQAYYRISDYRLWVVILFHILTCAGMAVFIILWQNRSKLSNRLVKSKT